MKYPEMLLLPLMMFADYFLTVLCAVQGEKGYARHFKLEHYELNPVWQKSIAAKKWFNLHHAVLAVFFSGVLIGLVELVNLPRYYVEGLLGCMFVLYGVILGRHISNLFIFSHLIRNPDEISGEVKMVHRFVLFLSLYQMLMILIPVLMIAVFTANSFACGGVLGIVLLMIVNAQWIRERKKQEK